MERPDEAKHFDVCHPFEISATQAELFFANARQFSYQAEEIMMGPCKAFGIVMENGAKAAWEIYIGGSGVLYRGDVDPQWFYCDKECCVKVGNEFCG